MHFLCLLNFNISTGVPHLGSSLTVPTEGKDIVSGLEVLGNLHQVLEGPGVSVVRLCTQGNLGPLGVFGGGALGGGDQLVGDPALLVEVFIVRLPVDPLKVAFSKTGW